MSGYPFQARPMIGVPQRYPTNSNPIHYPNPNLVHHDNTFQSPPPPPPPPPPPMPPQREGFLGIYQNPNPNLNSNPRALDGKYPLLPQEEIMRRDADVWHHKRERDFQNDGYGSDLCHGQNSLPEWGERNLYDSHPPSYGREFGLQQNQNKSFLPRHGNQFRVQGNQNEYFLSRVENPVGMPRMDSNIEEELLWKQPHKRIRIDARGNTQEIDGAGLPITDGRQNSSYSGNWHGELVLRNREDTFREDRVSMVAGPSREEELLLEHGLMEDRDAEKRRQEAQIEAERRNRFDAENPNRFDNDRYVSLDNRGHRFQEDSMRDLSNGSGARDFASSQRYSDFVNCKEGNRMPSHFPSHDYMNFQNNQTKRPQNGYLESRPSSDQSMYLGNEMHTYSLHHDREARNECSRDDDIIDKLHSDFVQRQRQKLTSQSYISDSQSMLGNDRGVGSVQHFQVEPNDRFVEPLQHIKAYNSMENVQNNIHNESNQRWNEVAHNSTYAKAQHQGIVGQEQVTSRNQFEDSDAVRDWHSEKLNFPVHETQLQAKTPYERFLNQESYDLDRPFQSEYNHSLFNQKHKSSHMIEVGPNCRSSPIPNGNEFQTCNQVPESATFQRQHAQSPEHTRFPPFQLSEQMPQPSNPPQLYNNAKVPSILPVTQLPGGSNVQSQHPPQPYYPHHPPPNSMPMSSNVQGELPQLPPPVPLAPPPPLPSSPPPPSPKRSSLPFIPHEVSPKPPVSSNFSSGPTSVPLLPTNMKSFPESKMAQGQGYPFQPAPVQHGPGFVSTGSQVIVHIPFQKFGEVDHPFSAKRLQDEKPRFIDAVNIFKDPGRASRPDRFVVILRGLPGSGKSYLAKALRDIEVGSGGSAPRIHSMDDYFMTEVEKDEENEVGIASSLYRSKKRVTKTVMEYCYEPEMEEAYRASMLKAFKKTVEEGSFTFVIVDDRNLRVADFAQFWATAKRSGYEVYLLEAPYKDPAGCAARNVHSFTSDKVQEMANRWEDAPPLYLQLNISSLIHTDELDARGITEVEMDTDEADLKTENHDVTIVMEKGQAGLASDRPIQIESINSQGRWTSEEDSDIKYEKKGFLRSKWSDTKDNDNEFVEQSKKEDSNALSGLMQIYGKGDKSVRWADQADKDRGFSIGIKARNKSSLIIGPGAGYNEVSNPIAQEDKDSPPRGNDSSGNVKKSRKIWEQLRAEQESFKAVFDRRRHRIGGMKEDDD